MISKYFTYENFQITLNRPELLLIKEFETLMSDEFNQCKEDETGKDKIKAFKIFKYLFLIYDHSSPYAEQDKATKQHYALEDSGLTLAEIKTKEVIAASIKYEVLNKSRLSKMLDAAQEAVDKFTLYFYTVDYTIIDDNTGKPVYNIKDGIASVAGLGKLVDGLKALQEQVLIEAESEADLRGGVSAGFMDR